MTGELSILGKVKPVGGVAAKVEAARLAGIKRVLIPADNYQELFEELRDIEVLPVGHIEQVFEIVFRQTYGAGAAAI
jgi:Lon-like ATP-dependent protease